MEIEYNNKKLALTYKYKIVPNTHSTNKMGRENGITTTQYKIPINNTIKKLANIRQVIFIYKHPTTNIPCITTQEPPQEINYKLIRTYTNQNQNQTIIQLPPEFYPLDKDKEQYILMKYYPLEEDPINPTHPLITLEIAG